MSSDKNIWRSIARVLERPVWCRRVQLRMDGEEIPGQEEKACVEKALRPKVDTEKHPAVAHIEPSKAAIEAGFSTQELIVKRTPEWLKALPVQWME
mmetsp:Transcript_35255/g.64479  ORF Transcript_35255/g.64479 Transcript_35255/m.64479 type:complete len:96 (-) Transcript_35255:67-354(-)